MKVRATATGFYGRLIQEGEEFDVPDTEEPASWFEPVVKNQPKQPKQPTQSNEG